MSIKSNNNQNKLLSALKSRIINFLFDNNINANNHSNDSISNNHKSLKSSSKKIMDKIRSKTDNIRNIGNIRKDENVKLKQSSCENRELISFVLKNCELTSPITDNDIDNDIELTTLQLHQTTNDSN
eukprot:177390_1